MFRPLSSIGQKGAKNNKEGFSDSVRKLSKHLGKKVATVALAFAAQYSSVLGLQPALASETNTPRSTVSDLKNTITEVNPSSELGTLDLVDKDLFQVDEIHSVENGLVFLDAAPVVIVPFIDTTANNQEYFLMYEDILASGANFSDKVPGLIKAFNFLSASPVIGYSDAPQIESTVLSMEHELQMYPVQKIRHYYSMIYYWSAMSKWQSVQNGTLTEKRLIIADSDKQDSEITRYTTLLNEVLDQPEYKGVPKYERMRGEVKLMKLLDLVNNFANLAADGDTIRKDLVNFVDREGYLDYLDSALTLFEETMNAFEAGDPDVSKDFLAVQRRMFHTFLVSDRRFAKAFDALPPVKITEQGYQTKLLAIKESTEKRVFQLLKRYHELVEKPGEYTNKQNYASHLRYADEVLEYAEAVSKHDSIYAEPVAGYFAPKVASTDISGAMPSHDLKIAVPAGEVENFMKSVLTTTEAIKQKYPSMEELLLPETTLDNVTQVASRVEGALDRYKTISAAQDAARRLEVFLAKREGVMGALTPGEKLELVDIFDAVKDSPFKERDEEALAAVMQKAVSLDQTENKTYVRVERYEDTKFTYDFKFNPVYREVNGITELTTVQPAHKVSGQLTFFSKLPINTPIVVEILYPNTRVVIDRIQLVIPPHQEAQVQFNYVIAAGPNGVDASENKLPDYQMQLASAEIPQMLTEDPEVKVMLASRTTDEGSSATYVASTPQTVVGFGAAMPETPNVPLNITTGVVMEAK